MPSTKTVSDAITAAQNEFKGITLASVDALNFANEIYQLIGNATYWDWLQTDGTSFGTVGAQQDYAKVPANLNRLRAMWIWDDSSGFTPILPLRIFEQQEFTNIRSIPRAVSVENLSFRLYPKPLQTRPGGDANPGDPKTATPGAAGSAGQWLCVWEYYKRPKQLVATTDTFEFDDEFFFVFLAGFVARVAQFVDDDQVGQWGGRQPDGKFIGTGRWGKFANMLNEEVRVESLTSGQPIYAPSEPIFWDVV